MPLSRKSLRQQLFETLPQDPQALDAAAWHIVDASPGLRYLATRHGRYRLIQRSIAGLGFSEWLLGASYASNWIAGASPPVDTPPETARLLENEAAEGRFLLVTHEDIGRNGGSGLPLFTLFRSRSGKVVLLELNGSGLARESLYRVLLIYVQLLAGSGFSGNRQDAEGDFLALGAPNLVQRHSSEMLRKHLTHKITLEHDFCDHCLRCVTSCAEMKAAPSTRGLALLGPAEAHCTNCGLCQQKCPYLEAVPREKTGEAAPERTIGSEALLVYGSTAASLLAWLQAQPEGAPNHRSLTVEKLVDHSWPLPGETREHIHQYRLEPGGENFFPRPLLATSISREGASPTLILRPATRAVLVLATSRGAVEWDMALGALRLGLELTAVVDPQQRAELVNSNQALPRLHLSGAIRESASLLELVRQGAVDLVLAPYHQAVSPEVHAEMLQRAGTPARIMAPQILQAFTFTGEPLLDELRELLLEIFSCYPELMEAEADLARSYLADLDACSAHIHARYRSMALASGHSACPTCAELQVLAVPVYMAIVLSLARGEIPEITFTCETGCMSETLNKVKEVAQKVRGGRTVFGGGFAFGEGVALTEELGIKQGWLPKQRRYVVSQSGDGGSVIGLPAWLNALRQKAFLVPQRQANVLHFINVTDTQVYSNTGGESSASSMLGMGTLTTPIGQYLLGNQRIQWQLINLAAEFPGILVGLGHSADKSEMQKFWHRADLMGRSAIRWDVTPCPETGKFFGEDPDHLAMVMAHAGFLPQVEFVGRLRKRLAPLNPADRGKPWREWQRTPKPIYSWLERDPRYRPLLRRNEHTGETEPINAAARTVVAQLERYRDQLNLQIDLEDRLVREAEEKVESLFAELAEQWQYHRHNRRWFPYRFLFNENGRLKPEYGEGLKREMTEITLDQDHLRRYHGSRQASFARQDHLLQDLQASLERIESLAERAGGPESDSELLKKIAELGRELKECNQETVRRLEEALAASTPASADVGNSGDSQAVSENHLYRVLDRLVEDRALAKQAEIAQMVLAEDLRHRFLERGGLITAPAPVAADRNRARLRATVQQLGPFAVVVASLAGERGIAINRIFSNLFTNKGAWAGMAWQFGSSKRGTPVLSATFVDAEPIERKDAMQSFPYYVVTVTNYGDLKANPDLFFDNLHPEGYLIINTARDPQDVRRELIAAYDSDTQELVARLQEHPAPVAELLERSGRALYQTAYSSLPAEARRRAAKLVAMASCHLITVDMDGIIQQVTGSSRTVSNLVAVAPIFKALQYLGLPLDLQRDRQALLAGFPGAVLKNQSLLDHYLQAIHLALEKAQGFPAAPPRSPGGMASAPDTSDPGTHLMAMGGTVAGMVLSQVATASHPLCYIGFPITPAGNPFYAMAEAYANGHPYIYVDEVNPSEKVAAEKLIGIARAGGLLPVTFTASQGWRLFTEIIPQFVGARLEGLFLITKRALAAPALNIEESHTDFMSFRDDGGLMLAPKSIQEYVPALYLARLMTHFAKLPVIVSIGGITDTHKIGLIQVPPDEQVRKWLQEVFRDFDFLEHKLLNSQGELVVHGPSATAEHYQETQSEVEKAHQAAMEVLPYAVEAVRRLTGYTFDELELEAAGDPSRMETALVLQGSLYPNAVEAVRELAAAGWSGLGCLSLRWFNPFPAQKLARTLRRARRVVVLDRSNSFGSEPPLASRVINALARHGRSPGLLLQVLVGGLGGREITVDEMRELLVFAHLILHRPESGETARLSRLLRQDETLQAMLDELAALHLRTLSRHTRVPAHMRRPPAAARDRKRRRQQLQRFLARKEYVHFLSNYGTVAFVGPRELMGETDLCKRVVLRLEILQARRLLSRGSADLRRALLLLHYSEDPEDWRLAAASLDSLPEVPGNLTRFYAGKLSAAGLSPASVAPATSREEPHAAAHGVLVSNPGEQEGWKGGPKPEAASLEFSTEEVELIRHWLAKLVQLNGSRELYYNPEDFKRALLRELARDPRSQLYHPGNRPPAPLAAAHEQLYGTVINRSIQREVLVQDFAPELEDMFEGEGAAALDLVVRGVITRERAQGAADPDAEGLRDRALAAARVYLQQRVFPKYPKRPGFYVDYYQAVVEPEIKVRINDLLETSEEAIDQNQPGK